MHRPEPLVRIKTCGLLLQKAGIKLVAAAIRRSDGGHEAVGRPGQTGSIGDAMRLKLLFPLIPCVLAASHEPGTVSGRVKDAAGRPVEGAVVALSGGGVDMKLLTDGAGAFPIFKTPFCPRRPH